jgi:hypothetical protein
LRAIERSTALDHPATVSGTAVRNRGRTIGNFFQKPKAVLTGSGAVCRIVMYPRKTGAAIAASI